MVFTRMITSWCLNPSFAVSFWQNPFSSPTSVNGVGMRSRMSIGGPTLEFADSPRSKWRISQPLWMVFLETISEVFAVVCSKGCRNDCAQAKTADVWLSFLSLSIKLSLCPFIRLRVVTAHFCSYSCCWVPFIVQQRAIPEIHYRSDPGVYLQALWPQDYTRGTAISSWGGWKTFFSAENFFQLMLKPDFFPHTIWSQIFFHREFKDRF